jgi:hypothetical protein
MTQEEQEAERVKALAASVYHQLHQAQVAEDYVRKLVAAWGPHPAFQSYMRSMLLTERLAEFISRPTATRM